MKYLPFSVQNLYQETAEQEHLPDISADSVFWINAFTETDVYQFSLAKKSFRSCLDKVCSLSLSSVHYSSQICADKDDF